MPREEQKPGGIRNVIFIPAAVCGQTGRKWNHRRYCKEGYGITTGQSFQTLLENPGRILQYKKSSQNTWKVFI